MYTSAHPSFTTKSGHGKGLFISGTRFPHAEHDWVTAGPHEQFRFLFTVQRNHPDDLGL